MNQIAELVANCCELHSVEGLGSDGRDKRKILEVVAKSTQAREAVKKAVEDKKATTTTTTKEEEIKAFRKWSWVFEKYLCSVDEGCAKDLKEIYDKPNESFDMALAITEEKSRCIKVYGVQLR